MSFADAFAAFSPGRTVVVIVAVAALASYDLARRLHHRPTHEIFACLLGTILSIGLIKISRALLDAGAPGNPYALALGVLLTALGWRALFGPWEVRTKATMLGTFLFWIALSILLHDAPADRTVRLVAAGVALVPAVVWCALFLKYHTERISAVLLMFLAGMLATVPILFYDALVRHGVAFNFFLFRLTPESFNQTSSVFVSGQLAGGGIRTALLTSLLSFVLVGVIEETSKYWVLSRSGPGVFRSIDDVLQLAIVVAIGFAFAENIVNPVYFSGFVRDQLLNPQTRDLGGFLTNIIGRSVLTTMVHIVSTGTMGYFLGLSIFADPYLREGHEHGRAYRFLRVLHGLLRLPEESVFRTQMLLLGLLCAITLHSIFNFLVTLPDMLPTHPRSLGAVLGLSPSSLLQRIPFLLLPSLFYVVGGFWVLTELALRRENSKERGRPVTTSVFVQAEEE